MSTSRDCIAIGQLELVIPVKVKVTLPKDLSKTEGVYTAFNTVG